jgi:hypothetical protein
MDMRTLELLTKALETDGNRGGAFIHHEREDNDDEFEEEARKLVKDGCLKAVDVTVTIYKITERGRNVLRDELAARLDTFGRSGERVRGQQKPAEAGL